MGCGFCKARRRQNVVDGGKAATSICATSRCAKPRGRASIEQVASEAEAADLESLITDDERLSMSNENRTLVEKVRCLRELVDSKPATISAVNLAGDTLADLQLSVNTTVADLEAAICKSASIDAEEFMLQITLGGSILSKQQQKLHEAGILPHQEALVTAIKSIRPKRVKNPALDRALFQEAWMGGGNAANIQALLDQNADPNGFTYSDGDQAIHVTAGRGYLEAVRVLIEGRADVNRRGVYGMTPLQRCSQQSTTYWKGRHPAIAQLIRAEQARIVKQIDPPDRSAIAGDSVK